MRAWVCALCSKIEMFHILLNNFAE